MKTEVTIVIIETSTNGIDEPRTRTRLLEPFQAKYPAAEFLEAEMSEVISRYIDEQRSPQQTLQLSP